MSELANSQASAIERRLSRSLSATRILAQGIRQNRGLFDGFESYADEVLQAVEGVSNLQLAPDGIIRYIHPLKGNEKAIGHNILRDDRRRKEAMQAIKEHRLTLAGPFELVQGGVAIIGRNPVYLPSENGEQFWGFASALIFLQDLLKFTELDPLGSKGYSYQLSRINPNTGMDEVFSSSATALTKDSYAVSVNVPNSSWQLIMSRSLPTPKWRSTTGYIASLLAGFLLAWIAYYVLQQPEKLRRIVNEKTHELERLAYHDHLTELANRRYLSEQLARVIREYARYGKPAVLMYLDLDDFKRVNDSMGHDAGDSLLRQIADRLNGCVRSSDLVARLGGDEFGILLLDSESVRDVSRIAEKLIETIEQPVMLRNKSFVVSTSVGITMIPADGEDVASILRNADMAMYSAKKAGKRNFSFYDKSLQSEAVAKLQLEDDLGVAVNQQQFVLHYQPIIELSSGELNGYEALIRWQHPERGLLYPDKFIGVAEESGMIVDIGYWVIQAVCNQIKLSESDSSPHSRFSINLSPKQFKDPLLLENIRNIVRKADVDASLLELEVTESSVMEDVDDAIATLAQLKEMGISVAIDDFGTGYSSLALLKHLPVDRLKIDRSFIRDLETDRNDKKIVQGVISMAHKLQLNVVAEGIENETQLQLLKHYQCDLGQGYLFSKPLPMDQLPHLS
ncbi:MAG: EAL domain-containing protein [Amphritea sp.]